MRKRRLGTGLLRIPLPGGVRGGFKGRRRAQALVAIGFNDQKSMRKRRVGAGLLRIPLPGGVRGGFKGRRRAQALVAIGFN
jgi:hypothetical protein